MSLRTLVVFLATVLLTTGASAQGIYSHTPAQNFYCFNTTVCYCYAVMDAKCGRTMLDLHVGAEVWFEGCETPWNGSAKSFTKPISIRAESRADGGVPPGPLRVYFLYWAEDTCPIYPDNCTYFTQSSPFVVVC